MENVQSSGATSRVLAAAESIAQCTTNASALVRQWTDPLGHVGPMRLASGVLGGQQAADTFDGLEFSMV